MKNFVDEKILIEVNERLMILGLPQIQESNLDNYLEKVVEISIKFGGKKGYLNNLSKRDDIVKLKVTNLKNFYNLYGFIPYFVSMGRGKGIDRYFSKIAFVGGDIGCDREKIFLKNMKFGNLFLFCGIFKDLSKFTREEVGFKKLSDGRIRIDDVEKFLRK